MNRCGRKTAVQKNLNVLKKKSKKQRAKGETLRKIQTIPAEIPVINPVAQGVGGGGEKNERKKGKAK